jgi:glutathione S-transferase
MINYELFCFGESGNAYKVALFLELSGIKWSPRFVDFFNGETRSDEFRAITNELGEAPVLLDGARRLTQSGAILHYLGKKHPQFGPSNEDEELEALRWMFFDNHKFTSYIATLRFMIRFNKTGETPVTEFLRARVVTNLKIVDRHLSVHPFMLGTRCTIADFSLCGYLFYGEELPFDLAAHANIVSWLERIRALPGWKSPYELMPRTKPQA